MAGKTAPGTERARLVEALAHLEESARPELEQLATQLAVRRGAMDAARQALHDAVARHDDVERTLANRKLLVSRELSGLQQQLRATAHPRLLAFHRELVHRRDQPVKAAGVERRDPITGAWRRYTNGAARQRLLEEYEAALGRCDQLMLEDVVDIDAAIDAVKATIRPDRAFELRDRDGNPDPGPDQQTQDPRDCTP